MNVVSNLLDHKKVLIVDDEVDVLATLEALLSMCTVVRASTFEEARNLLENQHFDMAVLDIMGVDGYKLLEIAVRREIIPVMLTAHALSPQHTVKSFKEGASFFVPKDKMSEIATFLNDVLEAQEAGRHSWSRWFERFSNFYNEKFGPDWQKEDAAFWAKNQFWE